MKLPWGLRWWELLPEGLLGAGLGLFLVTETSAATSAFRSSTAVGLMVLVGLAWLAGRFLLVRYTRRPALRLVVFGAAALGVLTVVVLPAYDDTTVVETFPVAVAGPTSTTGPPAAAPAAPTTRPPPAPTTAANPVSVVAPTTTAAATTPAPPPTTSIAPSPPPTAPPPTAPAPAAPVALRSAPLHGIDHRASGTAVVYRQPDGSLVVGLEGIDIQPGPDYDVYVVPGGDREDIDGGIRLDDLRGNQGTQYYPVPTGTDVAAGTWTLLVWCQTFDVPVAGATPS